LSCEKFGDRLNPPLTAAGLVPYNIAKKYMAERFDTVLSQLFQSIIEQLDSLDTSDLFNVAVIEVSIPAYISPLRTSMLNYLRLKTPTIWFQKSDSTTKANDALQ
jgi:hypothetical protein